MLKFYIVFMVLVSGLLIFYEMTSFAQDEGDILQTFNIFTQEEDEKEISYLEEGQQQVFTYENSVGDEILQYQVIWSVIKDDNNQLQYKIVKKQVMPTSKLVSELYLNTDNLLPTKMLWSYKDVNYTATINRYNTQLSIMVEDTSPESSSEQTKIVSLDQGNYFLFNLDTVLRFFPHTMDLISMSFWITPDKLMRFNIIKSGRVKLSDLLDSTAINTIGLDEESFAIRFIVQSDDGSGDYLDPSINLWYSEDLPYYLIKTQGGENYSLLKSVEILSEN